MSWVRGGEGSEGGGDDSGKIVMVNFYSFLQLPYEAICLFSFPTPPPQFQLKFDKRIYFWWHL